MKSSSKQISNDRIKRSFKCQENYGSLFADNEACGIYEKYRLYAATHYHEWFAGRVMKRQIQFP